MQRFHAARSRPTLAAAACGLLVGLALVLFAPTRAAGDGTTCQGSAQLKISTRHPVQLRPVAFDAGASHVSNGSIVFYDFSYGDRTDDATTQTTAVHAYQQTGTYLVRLNLVTSCNTVISTPAYHVIVRDGVAPTVTITYPKSGHTVHFGRSGLQLRGTAGDPSGVAHVDIAIQILSVLRAAKPKAAGCYWYDGHVSLRLRGCNSPLFFPVVLAGRRWAFRMNPRSQIPPGAYAVRIRASDRAGNRTAVFSPKLGDIQGFTLVP
jgi:hypothetical protein